MHELLTAEPGSKRLLLGNEAIVRGALEAGVSFATTYPGTPSSEIGDNFYRISQETDLYFEYSVNEKVALETAAAAAVSGLRTMCSMKHVGLNVAADALMTMAYIGVRGGMVVVSADDPSMHSSQNEQDNRYYARIAGLPVFEPADSQEALQMSRAAFELSETYRIPVLLRTTTRVNHSRTVVEVGSLQPPRPKGFFEKDPLSWVVVPMVGRRLHIELLKKLERLKAEAKVSPFNTVRGEGIWGVATSGVSYSYVMDAIHEFGIGDQVRILKLGMTYPLPDELFVDYLKGLERVLVVEELEPLVEERLKVVAQEKGLTLEIKGKGEGLLPRYFEFDPVQVKSAVARFFQLDYELPRVVETASELPQRPPNLCAGCPHRATYFSVRQALGNEIAVYPTDIGCYTLGLLPPLETADFLLCMGSSVSSAGGFTKAQDKPVVAFIGDSTFFHSGITGLINAVHNDHDFILAILDNGTTAMTGQQPHPGVELTEAGRQPPKVDIEAVVRGCGVEHVVEVNPLQVKKTVATVKELLGDRIRGVKVIISKSPCPLFERRVTGKQQKVFFRVTEECDMCRKCLDELGCPAFTYCEEDDAECAYISIDELLCSGCAVCAQICNGVAPKKKSA